jgi:tetratricopeptide (TPR) repeat protein
VSWRLALAAAMAVLVAPAVAGGQPTLWERARKPRSMGIHRTELAVEHMLMRIEEAEGDPSLQRDFALGALAMLELRGGAQLDEPRLSFLLGRLLASDLVRRDDEAAPILARVVATLPNAPFIGEAWYYLARSDTRLNRLPEAILAYRQALDLVWDPELLGLAYLYRGELEMMRLNRLADAQMSFRAALAQTTQPEIVARSCLALAAALERLGDLPSALEAAAMAAQVPLHSDVFGDVSILELPATDLEPPYEVHYRIALVQMALADRSDSLEAAQEHVAAAIDAWDAYLGAADSVRQPWSTHALRLRDACRRGSPAFALRPSSGGAAP